MRSWRNRLPPASPPTDQPSGQPGFSGKATHSGQSQAPGPRCRAESAIAIVVGHYDLATGTVRQVIARGQAELVPFGAPRGRRKLTRYLGDDENRWDQRFTRYLHDNPTQTGITWLRPDSIIAKDLSHTV